MSSSSLSKPCSGGSAVEDLGRRDEVLFVARRDTEVEPLPRPVVVAAATAPVADDVTGVLV